jgi:hypothetical protein
MPLGKIRIARWLSSQDPYDEPCIKIIIDMTKQSASLDAYIAEVDEAYASAVHAIRREDDRRTTLRKKNTEAYIAAGKSLRGEEPAP